MLPLLMFPMFSMENICSGSTFHLCQFLCARTSKRRPLLCYSQKTHPNDMPTHLSKTRKQYVTPVSYEPTAQRTEAARKEPKEEEVEEATKDLRTATVREGNYRRIECGHTTWME